MPSKNFERLEAVIEDALKSESLRPSPPDLHWRLDKGLRVMALANAERRIFRRRMAAAAALLAFIGLSSWAVAVVGDLEGILKATVPGALGYYDYWSVTLSRWGWGIAGLAVAVAGLLCAGCFLVERRIYRHANASIR